MNRMTENIHTIEAGAPEFPARLESVTPRVKQLYYIGSLPDDTPSCAIVGSRRCTPYGRAQAISLAKFLASRGVTVISGMAAGIDGYAHEGALAGGGKTFAVLGCGPDICYPKMHTGLYEAIRKTGGILSEYPPGTPPFAQQFPARNRIISGLVDVVVVVEAKKKSGSLITADFALEMGKTVLAYPGRIGDPVSEGTNALIAQGAGIVSSPESVLWEIEYACGGSLRMPSDRKEEEGKRNGFPAERIGKDAAKVYRCLGPDTKSAEELSFETGYDLPTLANALTALILEGLAEEVTPGLYLGR